MLSVVTEGTWDVVYVHADMAGLEELQKVLTTLKMHLKKNECEHDHLFTEAWGGNGLTASMLDQERAAGCVQVHHVKINAWTEVWRQKHGLQ